MSLTSFAGRPGTTRFRSRASFPRRLRLRPSSSSPLAQLATRLAAAYFNVAPEQLAARSRGRQGVARARQVAMYLAHVVFGLPLTDVGRAFGRDRTTAAHACRAVEDRRDDPAFDAALADLELTAGVLVELARDRA